MCTLYERISELCRIKGVTPSRMCLDLGMSKSTVSDLKSGRKTGLSAASANKISNYLGVTVGYLLGEETEIAPTMNGERSGSKDILDEVDVAFYGDYKELSEDDKETLRAMARVMKERQAKKNQEK